MGNRTKKNRRQKNEGMEITRQLLEYVLAATLLFFSVLVPLYTRSGYYQIGDAKFSVYKYIMLIGLGTFLAGLAAYGICFWKDSHAREMFAGQVKEKGIKLLSVTDCFVTVYLLFVILSILAGGYYEDALWGYPGWNMGFLSQLSFVLLYFFISRFGKYWKIVLQTLCVVAVIVFWFGVLHRLMIDPLGFYEGISDENKAQFLSTLGQASWYASFLAVMLPVGIGAFLYAKKKYLLVLSGGYVFLGFCTLVTQNSDSAYMALAGFMLVFFWFAVNERETLVRFLWVITMFLAAGKFMSLLLISHPNTIRSYDFATNFILHNNICYVFLAIFFLLSLAGTVWKEKWNYPKRAMRIFRNVIMVLVGAIAVVIPVLVVLNTKGMLPEALSTKLSSTTYMYFNDDWGNGRGKTWRFTVRMFSDESLLHKLLGVGPDCYYSYASGSYARRLAEMWGERALTNAHNEWLNMMINAGIFGVIAYIGIFVSAAGRFAKKKAGWLHVAFMASIISYMAYNFFCYQQVLCTPFLFVLMGMGEYLVREEG